MRRTGLRRYVLFATLCSSLLVGCGKTSEATPAPQPRQPNDEIILPQVQSQTWLFVVDDRRDELAKQIRTDFFAQVLAAEARKDPDCGGNDPASGSLDRVAVVALPSVEGEPRLVGPGDVSVSGSARR
jgi:hypothetical protein